MLFLMMISLYTSRIVLSTLGISDYGIYNVVGGFVALFTMVSGTMATATQRFLSYEIGKNCEKNITRVFSTSMMIHILLGLIILSIGETIGLWFINNKMVIPNDRMLATNIVYQFSLLTLIVNVLSVPYNASLIAYEKMSVFAYIGIFEAILKLLIVFLIQMDAFDKLVFYAFLLMLVAIGIRVLYNVYVKYNFDYCRCTWEIDKEYGQSMIMFIGFNFIGSIANILKSQGINVLLNLFFGTVVNAARGISVQVLNAVSGFVTNFQLALNPQIIKLYAAGEKEDMFKLMFRGSKFSYLLMLLISLPVIVETPYLLSLWLVIVPENTVIFVRLTLTITLIDSLSHTLITGVHASGNVKKYQLVNGTVLMMTLPLAYLVLKFGYPPYMVFVVSLCVSIVCHFIRLYILRGLIGFPFSKFIIEVSFRMLYVTILSLALFYLIAVQLQITQNAVICCLVSFLSVFFVAGSVGLSKDERRIVIIRTVKKIKSSYYSIRHLF